MKKTDKLLTAYNDFISEHYTYDKDAPTFEQWAEENVTKVQFFHERDHTGEIFAYFPEENYSSEAIPDMKTCYAQIGQHGPCDPDYVKACKKATPDQYASLQKELESIGYNLEIID